MRHPDLDYIGHMGRALGQTAQRLGCSERTLRRCVSEGLLHGYGLAGRKFELPLQEQAYVSSHWQILRRLRAILRTERNVRLAVLFGSTALGSDRHDSDIDLAVVLERDDARDAAALRRRLTSALGRDVHLVTLDAARRSPALFADILTEGRVLVDRESAWNGLRRDLSRVVGAADDEDDALLASAHAAIRSARVRSSA